MVETFYNHSLTEMNKHYARVYRRFAIVAGLHGVIYVILFSCRIAYSQARPNHFIANALYVYCGVGIFVLTARVVFLSRRLGRMQQHGSFEKPAELQVNAKRPFHRVSVKA